MKKILIALQFIALYAYGQNTSTIYIDPTYTGTENGTLSQPYNDWDTDITIEDNTTYLQKRGTEITNSNPIKMEYNVNVILGSYGSGPRAKINYYGTTNDIISISASSHCVVRDLELEGNIHETTAGVHIGGYFTGNRPANSNTVENCIIHDVYNGVRGLPYSTNIDSVRVWNTSIYNCMSDGIFIASADSVSIINTNVSRVNMGWHLLPNGHSQYVSAGDCIQLAGDCHSFLIKGCSLDRRYTGNKFCLIYNTGNSLFTGSGQITQSTFYPPKDTIGDDGGSCIYLKRGNYVKLDHNVFLGRDYPAGETASGLAHCEIDSVEFYYNLIDHVSKFNIGLHNKKCTLSNNTFVQTNGSSYMVIFKGTSCLARNNIFALTPGMEAIKDNSGGLINQTNSISFGNYNTSPGFVNWANGNYTLKPGSPCVNTGTNYSGWPEDLVGNPIQNDRDKGAFEFNDGSQSSNLPPEINNQSFNIPENSPQGTSIGTVAASDPNAGQILNYQIISGNPNNLFEINASSGELKIHLNNALNFEDNSAYDLLVEVTDNGLTPLSASATITVQVLDVNEPPVIPNQNFTIVENAPNGTWVGNIMAMDPDAGQAVTYVIQNGNLGSVFSLNASTGQLSVIDNTFLDFEAIGAFDLIIKVTDNSPEHLTAINHVFVQLLDINDPPIIVPSQFSIEENSANNSIVGTVSAFDYDEGQLLSYAIIGGNLGGTFQINPTSGVLSVYDNVFLNYETIPYYDLTIRVQDNGSGNLSAEAIMHISLGDVNDPPVIVNQQFSLVENADAGFVVGNVFAYDPDAGDQKTFSILTGNLGTTFSLNPYNGQLTVNDNAFLNYEAIPFFDLLVKVEDVDLMSSIATLHISLIDINDPPVFIEQNFAVPAFSPNGYAVGNISAYDPDIGQSIQFELLSGNLGGTFSLNPVTGEITVFDNVFLNPEAIPVFYLIIKVKDNGPISMFTQSIVNVHVMNVEPPQLNSEKPNPAADSAEDEILENSKGTVKKERNSLPFQLFPNPATECLTIQTDEGQAFSTSLKVFDLKGKCYLEKELDFLNESDQFRINISKLPPGLYLVSLFNDHFKQTEKLIVR